MSCSTREALRLRTADAHDRLHRVAAFVALERGDLALTDYTRLLGRLEGLHGPLEARLAVHGANAAFAWHGAPDGPARTARLRADLAALGLSAEEIAALPRADAALPALEDVDTALGAAWVAEGSAMGGVLIARWLKAGLGVGPDDGGAFFGGAPGQAARWRACCQAVEARGADPGGRARIVAGAEQTFAAFAQWLGAEA